MAGLRRLWAVTAKEMRHISRDLRTLLLVIVSPPFLLFVMGYIFRLEVQHAYLAVMDYDRGALSRRLVQAITADEEFMLRGEVKDYDQAYQALRKGNVDLVLVIPPGFSADALSGRNVVLQALIDGIDPIETSQTSFGVEARVRASVQESVPIRRPAGAAPEILSQVWYNPGLKSKNSTVPGLMAIVLTLPAMALALALARESETGTFEALIASPIKGSEYLLGKLLAYVGTGMVSSFLTLAVAVHWFHVPFRGSIVNFALLTLDFLLATMGIALLIGQLIQSQQAAMFISFLYFLIPSFFIAGLIVPVSKETLLDTIASYSLCTTHFIKICRGISLKGLGLRELMEPALILALMGVVSVIIGVISFRKEL